VILVSLGYFFLHFLWVWDPLNTPRLTRATFI
jgi:hypothetical protein